MMRQQVQHLHSFFLPVLFDPLAEDNFLARLMAALFETEVSTFARLANCPAREDARYFRDIILRVTAIDAEGVQFHQLASVVFIQAVTIGFALRWPLVFGKTGCSETSSASVSSTTVPRVAPQSKRLIRIRSNAQPVIKIKEHGRALRSGHQQIFKLSERVRTNHVALIARDQVTIRAFAYEHVEVVEPEIGHHFLELALAVGGAQELGLHEFGLEDLL